MRRRRAHYGASPPEDPDLCTSADPWYGADSTDPDAFACSLADAFVRDILKPTPGTRVAGFKEIRFHTDTYFFDHQLDFMRRFFPGCVSKVVEILRRRPPNGVIWA